MTKFTLTAFFAFALSLFVSGQSVLWNDIPDPKRETQQIYPESYRTMTVDFESLKTLLLAAPKEGTDLRNSNYILQLPTADGGRAEFNIVEESVMAPDLQLRYPNMRSYIGLGTGEYANANIALDFTLKGFHAQILIDGKSYYIDPLSPGDLNTYIIYSRESFFKNNTKKMGSCEPEDIGVPVPGDDVPGQKLGEPGDNISPLTSNGTQLRTYDLALACTGEYAQFHGGTKPLVLSAMVTTMTRVNGVYRSDLCLRMLLISNNDDLIFLNALTDGYTNNVGSSLLNENQAKINLLIGASNYDIGHVLSTGGGGIASLGVVCNNSFKARGVTGSSSPVGDPFDIDYVAHEMGHQWSANHTFNNSCDGNRAASAAYEPGSGSTIMGYAGICSPDLQSYSDAYFHNKSYNEIVSYSVSGAGNSCATITSAVNDPPTIIIPTGGFFIPKSTPFELTASATDPNNDALTYCWEQYDLGPATAAGDNNLTNPSGNAPIFRSWPPSSSSTRVFPRLSDLVNNTTVIGERLPTYARDLTFKLTVRDSYVNGAVNDAQIAFDVASNSGPFVVTSPNTAVTWIVGANGTINWNVANTTASPVSCSTVDIYLSTDGGYTYPTLLISNTANDGLQTIVVPNLPTTQARIKVKAAGNIFFDISNQNFTISETETGPANDAICSATSISCGSVIEGTTIEATNSGLDYSCAIEWADVFYTFTGYPGTVYTVTVNGTGYDGILAAYSGTCNGVLTELTCADNNYFPGQEETITFSVSSAKTIFIRTSSYSSPAAFTLSLNCSNANDTPCAASPISNDGSVFLSSNSGATADVGEVVPPAGTGSSTCSSQDGWCSFELNLASSVWFTVVAPPSGRMTVTTCNLGTSFDTQLALYSATNCNDYSTFSLAGANDDLSGCTQQFSSSVTACVTPGETYYIQVDGYGSARGGIAINATEEDGSECEGNCLNTNAFSSTTLDGFNTQTTLTTCIFEQEYATVNNAIAGNTYVFTSNGSGGGYMTVRSGTYNGPVIGNGFSPLTIISDISGTLFVHYTANENCETATGTCVTSTAQCITCPPVNDACNVNPTTLTIKTPGNCAGNETLGTTTAANGTPGAACEASAPDVFYTFNSGLYENVTINLSAITANDLAISVIAVSCSGTAIVQCSFGTNQALNVDVTPETNYYVRIHSYSASYAGDFDICIEGDVPDLATINGTITGWNSNCASRSVKVSLYNTLTTMTYIVNTTLTTSGTFVANSIDIPAGTYNILVKVQGALAVLKTGVILTGGANSLSAGSVILGDVNNNNVINALDVSAFSASFGTISGAPGYNLLADLNCDGVINFFDFSLLSAKFNMTGAVLP